MPYTPTYTGLERLTRALSAKTLAQLTTDTGAPKGHDEAVMHDACRKAEAEVELYLNPRYLTPLAPIAPAVVLPEAVMEIATELAIYWLYVRRGTPPEGITKRYNDAIAKLEKMRKGELLVALTPIGTDAPTAGSGVVVVAGRTRIFTDDLLRRL